jgi:hypothetical protein
MYLILFVCIVISWPLCFVIFGFNKWEKSVTSIIDKMN